MFDALDRVPFLKEGLAFAFFLGIVLRMFAMLRQLNGANDWLEEERDAIGRCRRQLEDATDATHFVALRQETSGHWVSEVLERAQRRTRLGAPPRLDDLIERLENRAYAKSAGPRTFGNMAVYVGLIGTLLGLTIAVYQLTRSADGAGAIKDQILRVVAGFTLTFLSALAGVVATVVLGVRNAAYDRFAADLVNEADDLLRTEVLPLLEAPHEKKREEAEARNEHTLTLFANIVTKAAKDFRTAATDLGTAVAEHKESLSGITESTRDLVAAARALSTSSKNLDPFKSAMETAAARIAGAAETAGTYSKSFSEGAAALNAHLDQVRPVNDALAAATKSLASLDSQVSHTVTGMRDLFNGKSEELVEAVAATERQHQALALAVAEAVENHQRFAEEVATRVRDMPLEVPLERLNAQSQAAHDRIAGQLESSAALVAEVRSYVARVDSLTAELSRTEDTAKQAQRTMAAAAVTAGSAAEEQGRSIVIKLPWRSAGAKP